MRITALLHENTTIYLCMFGYVKASRQLMPTASVNAILANFMNDFELSHDDYNIESLRSQYNRMQKAAIKNPHAKV